MACHSDQSHRNTSAVPNRCAQRVPSHSSAQRSSNICLNCFGARQIKRGLVRPPTHASRRRNSETWHTCTPRRATLARALRGARINTYSSVDINTRASPAPATFTLPVGLQTFTVPVDLKRARNIQRYANNTQ